MEGRSIRSEKTNRRGSKTAFQFWWEDSLREGFVSMCDDYDPEMDISTAIVKVLKQAVKDYYLPGYIKKERSKKVVENSLADSVIMVRK